MLFLPSQRRKRPQLRLSERRLLLMAGDTLAVLLAVLLALYIWSRVDGVPFDVEYVLPNVFWFFLLAGIWLLLASANDFYDLETASSRLRSLQLLAVITAQILVLYLLVFFFSPRDSLPRLFILYFGVAAFVFIALWRLLNPALLGWASAPRRVLIVGSDDSAALIIQTIQQHKADGYVVYGIIGQNADVGRLINGVPVIGTGRDIFNFVVRDRISELIITSIPDVDGDTFRGVMDAYEFGVELMPMPLVYERLTGRIPVKYVANNWAIVLPMTGHTIFNPYPVLQRMMDVVLAALGLMVLALSLPLLALIIRLDSPGGIFYTQNRTGLNGRNFRIVKFRTMIQNAEAMTGAVFSQENDPRITRVGRFMRKTRLDEVPQLLNVMRGEMSIVGPRPERPEHTRRLTEKIPFYRTRLVVRPGLTGWAQVRYRYGSDDEDAEIKLEYDLYYIRHQSLLLDISIMIRTVGKVLRMSGT